MFIYRHFGKWGFGVGLPTFLFIILPLWLAFEVAKAVCVAVGFVTVETFRAIRWANTAAARRRDEADRTRGTP